MRSEWLNLNYIGFSSHLILFKINFVPWLVIIVKWISNYNKPTRQSRRELPPLTHSPISALSMLLWCMACRNLQESPRPSSPRKKYHSRQAKIQLLLPSIKSPFSGSNPENGNAYKPKAKFPRQGPTSQRSKWENVWSYTEEKSMERMLIKYMRSIHKPCSGRNYSVLKDPKHPLIPFYSKYLMRLLVWYRDLLYGP